MAPIQTNECTVTYTNVRIQKSIPCAVADIFTDLSVYWHNKQGVGIDLGWTALFQDFLNIMKNNKTNNVQYLFQNKKGFIY